MQIASWIVLLPFIAGSLIILLPFLFPAIKRDTVGYKSFAMLTSIGTIFVCFWCSVLVFTQMAQFHRDFQFDWTWFQSGSFKLTVGLLIDNLTSVMLIVVTLVSLLVQIYTHSYMREDPGYGRFYAYLSLFTGSMLGLVVSSNLFQMYFFWELVGVCSYFLIGFWWYKPSAAYACMKAFVVNRIGDFGFLIAILMFLAGTWGFWAAHPGTGLLNFNDAANHVDLAGAIKWGLDPANHTLSLGIFGSLSVIGYLMFMGPMAKSAQFPLHVWLPDAMEGPTPISALIHAATMVAAGVYMVARAYPLWLNWADINHPTPVGSEALTFVAWIGTFTAFMAASIALTQFDIKRALAWSTVSQLGYMFAGLGVGAFTGGIFHLFTHAFFKAMLFLCSGAVIHALHGEQDMRKMGGLAKPLKWTRLCFLIGCLAISGVPGLSGFFSKDEIIGAAAEWGGAGHELLAPLLIFTAFLTAFYMFRMYFMTFSNEYRGEVHPHEEGAPSALTMPLLMLAVPSIAAGWLGLSSAWQQPFQKVIVESPFGYFVHWGAPEAINWGVMGISTAAGLAGIALSYMVYKAKSMNINTAFSEGAPPLYRFSFNKWYMDEVYLKGASFFLAMFAIVWTLIDRFIVDNLVNAVAYTTKWSGDSLRYSQVGKGQIYALVVFASVAAISLYVYFKVLP